MVQDIEEFTGTYPEAEYMSVADYAIDVANTLKENVDQYEENEQIRQSQENTRQTAENERETQESIRKNDENVRRISELERREKEEARRIAENDRQTAENVRQLSEGERIANEEDRIELYNDVKADYESGAFNGERGESGVYIGSGEMPSDCNFQVDPNGTFFEPESYHHIIDGDDEMTIRVGLRVNGDLSASGNISATGNIVCNSLQASTDVTCMSADVENDLYVGGETHIGSLFLNDVDINDLFANKQNTLAAGAGIDISNDTISSVKMIEMTRAKILTLSRNKKLKKGMLYRITDYSLNDIQYDIVIMAESDSKFNENARAIKHEGDTYFSNSNLAAWQLKYCISIDSDRFAWASDCPRGVVYWMKDEFGNEAPYDFKAIKFTRTLDNSGNYSESGTGTAVFTFNNFSKETTICSDASLTGKCRDNVIKPYVVSGKLTLNNNVFLVNNENCIDNTIYTNSHDNTLTVGAGNIIGSNSSNCFVSGNGCSIGNNCQYCKINVGTYVTIGSSCTNIKCYGYGNKFGDGCYNITLGSNCNGNVFGQNCGFISMLSGSSENTFGNYVTGHSLTDNCSFAYNFSHNYIGSKCQRINVGKSFVEHCVFESGIGNINVTSSGTSSTWTPIRYLHFNSGCNEYKEDLSNVVTVSVPADDIPQTFKTVYGKAADNKINI